MKTSKFFLIALMFAIFVVGCTEEGPMGPAGADGTNGTNGTNGANGTNGTNGIDGYGAVTVADQASYDAADGLRGGILYDNWTSTEAAISNIPTEVAAMPEFFRCKSCHAWDGLGAKASYINRAGTATRPNCASSDLRAYVGNHNIKETFNAVKHMGGRLKSASSYSDVMPDYSTLISDNDVWDLVKYLFEEAINVDLLYVYQTSGIYPTGTVTYSNIGRDGVAAAGDAYLSSKCASCHGADGTDIDLGGRSLGKFGRTKPNELWHKAKFGQLGSSMGAFDCSVQELKDLYSALQDKTKWPD
ncbi:MAG: c-type cytochrome [Prolixibacteraceae bacterium]